MTRDSSPMQGSCGEQRTQSATGPLNCLPGPPHSTVLTPMLMALIPYTYFLRPLPPCLNTHTPSGGWLSASAKLLASPGLQLGQCVCWGVGGGGRVVLSS